MLTNVAKKADPQERRTNTRLRLLIDQIVERLSANERELVAQAAQIDKLQKAIDRLASGTK